MMISIGRKPASLSSNAIGDDSGDRHAGHQRHVNSSDRPMAPPRNSARSVAIAAISLTPHMAWTTGRGNVAAQFGQVAAGDDAELGRQRLEQHRDQVGQAPPRAGYSRTGAGLDVGREIARIHIGDRGDHRGPGEASEPRTPPLAGQHLAPSRQFVRRATAG